MPSGKTAPTRTGYKFGGYYTKANGGGTQYYNASMESTKNWNIASDTTLYAKWTANKYTVKFNANGGTGTMSNQSFTYGEAQKLSANKFTRKSHLFKGWSKTPDATKPTYTDEQSVSNLSSTAGDTVTLYAIWQENAYELTVTTQSEEYGKTNTTGGTKVAGTSITVKATPEDGYVFAAWKDENCHTVSTDAQYQFTMPSKDYYLKATFTFDIKKVSEIKVLNVYPTIGDIDNSNTFKSWMDSYGANKIKVTPISIEKFNENPTKYLGTADNWKYDVVVFGFWDCNNYLDLNSTSSSLIRTFIKADHSVIFGHDTISGCDSCGDHTNFNKLAKYVNIAMGSCDITHSENVYINKKGIFNSYPHNIGNVGTILDVPKTHVYGQIANGDIWLTFADINLPDENNFYLTTSLAYNTAMIQTGHSNGLARTHEQQVLADTIFYLYSQDKMPEKRCTKPADSED